MAINTVRALVNGTWHTLTLNGATGKYEKTITAPSVTSWNVNAGRYYPITIEATNTAGTTTTVNDASPTIGNSLKLIVKERVKPTITITSPGASAYVINNRQPIVFQLRDEVNGSGVNLTTLALKIDGGTTITSASSGMVCTPVTNGFDCTYTPPAAIADGAHTVTINVTDNDGNTANQISRTYTIDTVPPILNVTSPVNNFITNSASITVQGNTNDATSSPVSVNIVLNTYDQGAVTLTNGNFSKTLTILEGINAIVITATDAAGKSTQSTITGRLDTTVPVISNATITPNPVDAGATMVISIEVTG